MNNTDCKFKTLLVRDIPIPNNAKQTSIYEVSVWRNGDFFGHQVRKSKIDPTQGLESIWVMGYRVHNMIDFDDSERANVQAFIDRVHWPSVIHKMRGGSYIRVKNDFNLFNKKTEPGATGSANR